MSGLDVTMLRGSIPALAGGTAFFDGPGGTQTPRAVADAIAQTLCGELANRGTVTAGARRAEVIVGDARAAMADLLGADPRGVVFGRSATQLVYDVARTLARDWGPGDEVVVTRLDHDAHIRPWVQAAQAAGAGVRWLDFDPATGELDDVATVLGARTRLVAVTGASNLIGTRPPVAEIAARVHDAGALLSVDAVHLAAHAPIDLGLGRTGPDLLFCSPYKFMGPHLGVFAASVAWLETLRPDKLAPSTDAVPERFELGTLPYELLAGVSAAIEVIAGLGPDGPDGPDGLTRRARVLAGMAAVEEHEDALRARLERGLDEMRGVTRHARAAHRTPTQLLTFAGQDAAAVAEALAGAQINAPAGSFYAPEASRRLGLGDAGGLRIGLAPYTSEADVDRLLAGIAAALA